MKVVLERKLGSKLEIGMSKILKISEIFLSHQGEIDVGTLSIFIRFSGCNLIREGKGCKFCDTVYAEDGDIWSIDQIVKEVLKYNCHNIVITGGESLVQREGLFLLILNLLEKDYRFKFSLETNGTIYDNRLSLFSRISCSPKKQVAFSEIEVLSKLVDLCQTRFKFVYESKEDLWWESLISYLRIEHNKVWIMPEGISSLGQLSDGVEVIKYCREKEFNFSPRLHVLLWGAKRGV